MSSLEQPLPSTVTEKMRNSNRMVVKNWPSGITKDEIASIFNGYGPVKHVNIAPFSNSSDAEVVFGDPATAWKLNCFQLLFQTLESQFLEGPLLNGLYTDDNETSWVLFQNRLIG